MVFVGANLERRLDELNPDFSETHTIIPKENGIGGNWVYQTQPSLSVITKKDLLPNTDLWNQGMKDVLVDQIKAIYLNLIEDAEINMDPYHIGILYSPKPIQFGLENAFLHGNKNNPDLEVKMEIHNGEKGALVRIVDSGEGFDYKSKIKNLRKLQKTHGEHVQDKKFRVENRDENSYFTRMGTGFIVKDMSPLEIFYSDDGKALNIVYPFLKSEAFCTNKANELRTRGY